MGKAHFFYIRHQVIFKFDVTVKTFFISFNRPHPAAQMHFIHTPGCSKGIVFFPFLHPGSIFPLMDCLPGYSSGCRPQLTILTIRVSLFYNGSLKPFDIIFISFSGFYMGDKTFPDTRFIKPYKKRMQLFFPSIKFANNRNFGCIGCPNGKVKTGCI